MVRPIEDVLRIENLEKIGKGSEDGLVRPDDVQKATGTAMYSVDQRPFRLGTSTSPGLSGVLEARALRSVRPHARIRNVDTSKAEEMEGVEAVITGADAVPHAEYVGKTQPEEDKVHYFGDIVAAVAAEDELTAQNATERIEVEYEELPHTMNGEDALDPDEPVYSPDRIAEFEGGQAFVDQSFPLDEPTYEIAFGELDAELQRADAVIEERYRTNTVKMLQPEPRNATAVWNGDKLTVWATSQNPGEMNDKGKIARSLGIPLDDVRLICRNLGGGFAGTGCSTGADSYFVLAALLARKAGKAVRLEFTRSGQTAVEGGRAVGDHRIRMGVSNDGEILGWGLDTIYDQGEHKANATDIAPFGNLLFSTTPRAVDFKCRTVYTNKVCTYKRGYGSINYNMAVGQAIDEAAVAIGMDPIELYRKNHSHYVGENPQTPDYWFEQWSEATEEMEDAVTDAIGWSEKWRPPEERSGRTRTGLGFNMVEFTSSAFEREVLIRMDEDGAVRGMPDTSNMGCDIFDAIMKAIAEVMQLDYAQVHEWGSSGDTDMHGDSGSQVGSSGARSLVGPYSEAAADLRAEVVGYASEILDAAPDEFEIEDGGRITVEETGESITYADVAEYAGGIEIHQRKYEDGKGSLYRPHLGAAEIEVDLGTGEIKPVKYVDAIDVGKVINDRNVVEAQLQGGALHGIGYALLEDQVYDEQSGAPLGQAFSIKGYGAPTFGDLIDVEIDAMVFESLDDSDTLTDWDDKVGGVGEHASVFPAPILANAFYNATGVRIREFPLTPDVVIDHLEEEGVSP